jgi:phosphatidylserine/phosphatidylglycerophosphate/cardiolipin synthase-like enzyme
VILFLLLQWQVFFSPNGGAEKAIVRNIDSARSHILVQAYSFTSEPVASALIRAKQRGCFVQMILDKGQRKAKGSQWLRCAVAGIPYAFDLSVAIQHSKVIILDSVKVITGSYNFSKAAEKSNAENLLIIRDSLLALQYIREWHNRNEHR